MLETDALLSTCIECRVWSPTIAYSFKKKHPLCAHSPTAVIRMSASLSSFCFCHGRLGWFWFSFCQVKLEVNHRTALCPLDLFFFFLKHTHKHRQRCLYKMGRNIHVPASVLQRKPAFHWQKGRVTAATTFSPVVI